MATPRYPVLGFLAAAVISAAMITPAHADRPRLKVLDHPSPEELEQGFKQWAGKYEDRFTFTERGVTPGGRPVLMGRITDHSVADIDKQIVLLTCAHCARETQAATGLLRFMKWLMSDDPGAAAIRKGQIVLVVPYPDPDNVALGEHGILRNIFERQVWGPQGVTDPTKYPEAVILQGHRRRVPARAAPRLPRHSRGWTSAEHGYHIRRNPGTVVEVAIAPDKVRDAHTVTCVYDTQTKRRVGFTHEDWRSCDSW
jgi:hypothetical protein